MYRSFCSHTHHLSSFILCTHSMFFPFKTGFYFIFVCWARRHYFLLKCPKEKYLTIQVQGKATHSKEHAPFREILSSQHSSPGPCPEPRPHPPMTYAHSYFSVLSYISK